MTASILLKGEVKVSFFSFILSPKTTNSFSGLLTKTPTPLVKLFIVCKINNSSNTPCLEASLEIRPATTIQKSESSKHFFLIVRSYTLTQLKQLLIHLY